MFSDPEVPLTRSVDVREPLDALRALAGQPHPFLLHSGIVDSRSRWSFFGADPFAVFAGPDYDAAVTAWRCLARRIRDEEPRATAVPFTGGAVGY